MSNTEQTSGSLSEFDIENQNETVNVVVPINEPRGNWLWTPGAFGVMVSAASNGVRSLWQKINSTFNELGY